VAALLEENLQHTQKDDALCLIEDPGPGDEFPVGWWIALYARMIHQGWPKHAYAAKRRAARLVIARQADGARVKTPEEELELAQALIYDEQYKMAERLLEAADFKGWMKPEIRQARYLGKYLRLVNCPDSNPRLGRIRPKKGSAERRFFDLVNGKSVAVVGPALTGQQDGPEIDSFDVVVRMNIVDAARIGQKPAETGTKTTVCYYNSTAENRQHLKMMELLAGKPFQYVVLRIRPPADRAAEYRAHVDYRVMGQTLCFFGEAPPLAVPRTIWDLARFEPARIKVFNADFYTGAQRYTETYRTYDYNLAEGLSFHDLFQGYDFTARMFAAGVFEADGVLDAVLRLGMRAYLDRIEAAFEREPPR
jgi:hypothetical protein